MKSIRKITAALLAVMMMATMLLSGCSTPDVAMTVDGKEYTTGQYLAALYDTFNYMFYQNGLYQYSSYGMDPWEQSFGYGEEGAEVEMKLADFIVAMTKDGIIRQTAVEKLMEKYGVSVSEEDLAEVEKNLADVSESEMLQFGFSKASYKKMTIQTLFEQNLFMGLYDEGGERAVAEDDVRKFYDDSYVAYKAITIAQTNENGEALSDEDKAKNKETLDKYLAMFNEKGDMDAVIEQYKTDTSTTTSAATTTTTAAEGATTTTAAEETVTTTTEAPTTTTEAETTTEAVTTTTVAEETETTTTTAADATETETEEEETDPNLILANTVDGDEKVVEAVKTVEIGKAAVVEYTDANGTAQVALIYRLNVDEAAGDDYYGEQRETCLRGLKFDEFNEEVKATIAAMNVEVSDRAIEMCDPKNFLPEE